MSEPVNSADFHQQRGIALDIIDEALNTYHEFMLDDDFDSMATLRKIMDRMAERRAALTRAGASHEG